MLGFRKVDSLGDLALFSLAGDFTRPGAIRAVVEELTRARPDLFCLHGIDAGDAFAMATRFDCDWAYRGGQALFWKSAFHPREVHDRYLPTPLLRPFERRGFLEVDGEFGGKPVTLIATELSPDRAHVREVRFVRTALRHARGPVLFFVARFDEAAHTYGFADLGLRLVGPGIYAKA